MAPGYFGFLRSILVVHNTMKNLYICYGQAQMGMALPALIELKCDFPGLWLFYPP
jgi:hypothetical protein